nr:Gag-Pol polyprotein [Tanacetum cinerariifolium]
VDDDEDTSKDKEIDKLMDLISLSFKKIYKPTNNNLRTSANTSRANQDNSLRIHKNAGYEGQRSGTVAGARETVEQVIGNPSQSVRTRRQLESDAEMCIFTLTVSRTEPKNIKEAMADSAWIESMQEELH